MSKTEDFEVGDLLRSELSDDEGFLFFLVKKQKSKNEFAYFVIGTGNGLTPERTGRSRFYFLDSFIFNKEVFKKV